MGTVASLILAGLFLAFSSEIALTTFPIIVSLMVAAFLLAFAVGSHLTAGLLQKAAKGTTPRVIELFKQDRPMKIIHGLMITWSLISLLLAMMLLPSSPSVAERLVAVWLVLTGCAFDMASYLYRRILSYVNPFAVTVLMQEEAKREIAGGRDAELCSWIDAFIDKSMWAIKNDANSVCNASVDALRQTLQHYLSWHRRELKGAASDSEAHQRVSYILHFAFDRLALLYNTALDKRFELTCGHIISTLGKVAVTAADTDISLTPYAVRYIGALSKKGIQAHFDGAGLKAMLTLAQVSKLILSDHDISQTLIEKPFVPIVRAMEEIAKESFRQDREISISLLTGPVQELKAIFQHERYASHPDTPAILREIDRVLADFANLELVLRTLPPIPEVTPSPATEF